MAVARHADFAARANQEALRRLGRFAVDLFGYPYDKDEIAKIAARIVASKIGFTRRVRQAVKRDREYICSEYVWECYKSLGIHIAYDRRGFIAPADYCQGEGRTAPGRGEARRVRIGRFIRRSLGSCLGSDHSFSSFAVGIQPPAGAST